MAPRFALPIGWREWDQSKPQAVLAHEEVRVQRRDLGHSGDSCVHALPLWFPPLSWRLQTAILASLPAAGKRRRIRTPGARRC
jgi:hypothetical protein